ncbi:MAG TPA: hypothetical protein VMV96_00915 [Acidimicrobiales bacterium]|nr:hypothetical protein [Acidimicrobiales bacterium]
MIVSLGAATTSSGATTMRLAGASSFCKTLMSFSSVKGTPSVKNVAAYRRWVITNLPRFQKLESEAPNPSVKKVLAELVTIMQSQSKLASAQQFQKSIAANHQRWNNDFKVFFTTAMSCVTNISNLY